MQQLYVARCVRHLGPQRALAVAPEQSCFIALSLTTTTGQVVKLPRAAGAVASAQGLWSLGARETFIAMPERPGEPLEDLFDLAKRAASEELGLAERDCGHIWFTWFGFSRTDGPLCVAHIRTSLSTSEMEDRIWRCHSNYEIDAIEWMPVGGPEHRRLASVQIIPTWLAFTSVVARGLLDIWESFDDPPTRY